MKELLDMFLTFARIGGFTFGGGYAMLPMLQKEVVNGRHWATDEELMDYYAIGQCTPGIIAVNTATFVGYKNRGIPGAIAATLGVIAPSLVIIMIIAAFISNFIELSFVSSAFAGIRACVCVLIGSAVVKLAKKSLVDKGAIAIAAVTVYIGFSGASCCRGGCDRDCTEGRKGGEEMMLILELCFRFFCCGLFAVGGGLATLPFLYNISKETGWYTFSDISNMIAVSESTPGPMGVNMATYVGFHIKGILGGLASPLSLVLPSVIIIIIISKILDRFKASAIVQNALYGLRAASTALIAAAGIGVAKIAFLHVGEDGSLVLSKLFSIINWKAIVLALAIWYGLVKWKKHPIFYIVAAAVIGIVFQFH